jgi:hypothetical protein
MSKHAISNRRYYQKAKLRLTTPAPIPTAVQAAKSIRNKADYARRRDHRVLDRVFLDLSHQLGEDRAEEVRRNFGNSQRGQHGSPMSSAERSVLEKLQANTNGYVAHLGPRSDERLRALAALGHGVPYEYMGKIFAATSLRTLRSSKTCKAKENAISVVRPPRKKIQSVATAEQEAMAEHLQSIGQVQSGSATGSVGIFFSKEEVYLAYREQYCDIMRKASRSDTNLMPSQKTRDQGRLTRVQRNLVFIFRGVGNVPKWSVKTLRVERNMAKSSIVGNTPGGPTNTVIVDGQDFMIGTFRLFEGFESADTDQMRKEILYASVPLRTYPLRGITLTSKDFRTFLIPNAVTHKGTGLLSNNVMDFFFEMLDEKHETVHASLRSRWWPAATNWRKRSQPKKLRGKKDQPKNDQSQPQTPPKYGAPLNQMSQHSTGNDAPIVHIVKSQLILVPILTRIVKKKNQPEHPDAWSLGVIDTDRKSMSVFDAMADLPGRADLGAQTLIKFKQAAVWFLEKESIYYSNYHKSQAFDSSDWPTYYVRCNILHAGAVGLADMVNSGIHTCLCAQSLCQNRNLDTRKPLDFDLEFIQAIRGSMPLALANASLKELQAKSALEVRKLIYNIILLLLNLAHVLSLAGPQPA